jgi:hypothetical protein
MLTTDADETGSRGNDVRLSASRELTVAVADVAEMEDRRPNWTMIDIRVVTLFV